MDDAESLEPDDAVSGESLFLFLAFYLLNILYYCHVSDHFCIYYSYNHGKEHHPTHKGISAFPI